MRFATVAVAAASVASHKVCGAENDNERHRDHRFNRRIALLFHIGRQYGGRGQNNERQIQIVRRVTEKVHVLQRVAKFQESAPKVRQRVKNRRAMASVMAGSSADSDRRFNTGVRIAAFNFEIIEPVVKKANRVCA